MTERKYRSYTEEFKLEALALLEKHEKSAGHAAQMAGSLSDGRAGPWERASGTKGPGSRPGGDPPVAARSERAAGGARHACGVKKAVNIFSRKPP